MSSRKAALRTRLRAARADRLRQRDEGGRTGGTPGTGEAMLSSWRQVLDLLGLAAPTRDGDAPSALVPPTPSALVPALFVPTPSEPDVLPLLAAHPRSLLPVLVTPSGVALPGPAWASHEGDSDTLSQPDPRRPAQPEGTVSGPPALREADVVLVAALAVDLSGTRLGQGGGWYDRALTHLRPGTPVVAAVFDEEVLGRGVLPREAHDHPVEAVITPTRALLLG